MPLFIPSEEILLKTLKERFGFEQFRPGQLEAIQTLFSQQRLLCILPTGQGKSLLYQLPSLFIEGITVVLSPLLALMRDQLSQLNTRFAIPAASINSDQTEEENKAAIDAAQAGKINILFIAPEQLDHLRTFQFLLSLPISFLVIDEAHCISTWGHDFRPSYRSIVKAVQEISSRNQSLLVLALTATANTTTEHDIPLQLQSTNNPLATHRASMDRPNLQLSVIQVQDTAEKLERVKTLLSLSEGTTLIYCATRENVELVEEYLDSYGIAVKGYHAGLSSEEKRNIQQQFFSSALPTIVATNALGMGIDKRDIRLLIHFDIPGSITSYYQEVGRAGRDGKKAKGILFFDPADKKIQEHFITSAQPKRDDVGKVLSCFSPNDEGKISLSLSDIKIRCGLHPTLTTVILAELVEQGFLEKQLVQKKQEYVRTLQRESLDLSRYTVQKEVRTGELLTMMAYGSEKIGCRMAYLRRALGDKDPAPCGHCDSCLPVPLPRPVFSAIKSTQEWLLSRPVLIGESKRPLFSEGLAVLDGSLKTAVFRSFMTLRTSSSSLPDECLSLFHLSLKRVQERYSFGSIVLLPSRTWLARKAVGVLLGEILQLPVLDDLLYWEKVPEKRQGELLNNDQRRENVKGKLRTQQKEISSGALLLVDDYIGSGATLREAVRSLREDGMIQNDIIPFTLARVRWKLGQPGMI